jgi:hypothetical protein
MKGLFRRYLARTKSKRKEKREKRKKEKEKGPQVRNKRKTANE